ncbi:hypothetical protein LCGC14_1797310, partial [marine sediment metagenome]
ANDNMDAAIKQSPFYINLIGRIIGRF